MMRFLLVQLLYQETSPAWLETVLQYGVMYLHLKSTTSGLMSRLSRTGPPIPNDAQYNGLWSCIQEDRKAFSFIGIYNRGEGKLTYTLS